MSPKIPKKSLFSCFFLQFVNFFGRLWDSLLCFFNFKNKKRISVFTVCFAVSILENLEDKIIKSELSESLTLIQKPHLVVEEVLQITIKRFNKNNKGKSLGNLMNMEDAGIDELMEPRKKDWMADLRQNTNQAAGFLFSKFQDFKKSVKENSRRFSLE